MMQNLPITYTMKTPNLHFISIVNRDELDFDQPIDQEFAQYIQWQWDSHVPDSFQVNLQQVYQEMSVKYPWLTLDVCLGWYLRIGNILLNNESAAATASNPELTLDYHVVIANATEDLAEHEYQQFSKQQRDKLDDLAKESSLFISETNDHTPDEQAALTMIRQNPPISLVFLDKNDHYFLTLPVIRQIRTKIGTKTLFLVHFHTYDNFQEVKVTMAQMKSLLKQVPLVTYHDCWLINLVIHQHYQLGQQATDNIELSNPLVVESIIKSALHNTSKQPTLADVYHIDHNLITKDYYTNVFDYLKNIKK